MVGNCEKMLLISSPSNEWSELVYDENKNQLDDPKGNLNNTNTNTNPNNMASVVAATDQQQHHHFQQQKQQQQQQQRQLHQQQQALKCPRCDSTNTKFCYYNNYSLSQPRHFCRACKRYWTRGGTLRNVPVGGGCRKNKRVRRSSNTFSSTTANTNTTNTTNTNNNSLEASINSASSIGGASCNNGNNNVHDLVSSTSNHVNYPLFYGLPTNHSPNSDINFPFSRYDLQNPPQINGLGLGFSSGLLVHNMHNMNLHHPSQNTKQISHDLISPNPLISSTTSNITSNNTPSTISSLLHQIKGVNNFQTLLNSYHDGDNNNNNDLHMKNVKIDHHHHNWGNTTQNQIDHHHQTMVSSSDPSILWGSSNGTWLDPSNNLGSSVPSLI